MNIPFKPISHEAELTLLAISEYSRVQRVVMNEMPPDLLIETVAHYFGLSYEKLISSERTQPLSTIRQCLMWYFRNQCRWSFAKTANMLGGRNHATALSGCKKVDNRWADPYMNNYFTQVMTCIESTGFNPNSDKLAQTDKRVLSALKATFGDDKSIDVSTTSLSAWRKRHGFTMLDVSGCIDRSEQSGLIVRLNHGKKTLIKFV